MGELNDYSGEFQPKLTFESFSKEALVKLCDQYARIYLGYMGVVNTLNRKLGKLDPEAALAIDEQIYCQTARTFAAPGIAKALNIEGNDVITLLKLMQTIPDGTRSDKYESDYAVIDNNHVILTIRRCPTLAYWERRNDNESIRVCCSPGGTEEKTIVEYANTVNPDITVTAIETPPHSCKSGFACRWELKLEPRA